MSDLMFSKDGHVASVRLNRPAGPAASVGANAKALLALG